MAMRGVGAGGGGGGQQRKETSRLISILVLD